MRRWPRRRPNLPSATAATARRAAPSLQLNGLDSERSEAGEGEGDGTTEPRGGNPTVVLLHEDPEVFLFGAVGKRAVPDVDALLPCRHVHADLERDGWHLIN